MFIKSVAAAAVALLLSFADGRTSEPVERDSSGTRRVFAHYM
jgi:hypothetical protein